ncbi:MAG TPA: DEAD/DEAH box helicase, partial [Roseococcus sp.]|nr:DEAD/DEAH box helicase [Roseococcus sp.]
TGSGKTVAYGLALAGELLGEAERLPPAGAPLALVVAPTRELALQVKTELAWLYASAGGHVVSVVGGMDPMTERRALSRGAHIVVGTPGRMRDHIERNNLDTKSLRAVVLDEADEMLDLGFREELEAILDTTPSERRTLLFSATVPRPIAQLAKQYQRDALRIEASNQGEQHGDIEYRASLVAPHEMERAVVNILRLEDPRIAMVFCATRATVARLHGNLSERGFSAVALSGELSQTERTRALQNLRDGRARICVATDVAARGIDLPDLGLVLHAELPRDPDTLLHRSGRTGRAGRKGISWLIVPHPRRRLAERLFQAARVKVALAPAPTADAVRIRDGERLAEQARALLAEEVEENDAAIARTLLEGASPEALAATVVKLLRGTMPAPEELSEPPERQGPAPRMPHAQGGGPGGGPGGGEDGIWFRMDVGRDEGADPKWMLPFLCRRGHVTREAIGRIRILGRETQFEVAPAMAEKFASAIRKPVTGQDGQVRIEPVGHLPRAAAHAPRAAERPAPRSAGPRQRR